MLVSRGVLTSVKLSERLKVIGSCAFAYCFNLVGITVPDSCYLVEFNAFASCFSLESVKLSNSMGLIDESTFEGCRSLKYIDLPTKLVKIGRRAFKGCTSLASIILPITVKAVGLDAFCGCRALARIAIPKDLSDIEDNDVFGGCNTLTEISFGGSREAWETVCRGGTLTVSRSDGSIFTPKIYFMDLK